MITCALYLLTFCRLLAFNKVVAACMRVARYLGILHKGTVRQGWQVQARILCPWRVLVGSAIPAAACTLQAICCDTSVLQQQQLSTSLWAHLRLWQFPVPLKFSSTTPGK